MTAAERADLGLLRLVRSAARPPAGDAVGRFSRLGEHAALWLALGAFGALADRPRRARWKRGVFVVAATYAANTAIKALVKRRLPAAPLYATAAAMACSRVYLGVHYPSDVAGGALLGLALGGAAR